VRANEAIIKLLEIIAALREKYPHKRFTLDGRLVGDLGEVIAEENYKLTLFEKVVEKYDAKGDNGKLIQIKATFNDKLGFPCELAQVPDLYLGIKISKEGRYDEIFNGPGKIIWEDVKHRKIPKNNLHNISLAKLKELNMKVVASDRILKRN
jgi:hypothetical protein